MSLVIALVAIAIPIIIIVGMYNGLINAKNTVDESWSDVDTELKRRYNLIPNLVNTVKGYATHEQETLDAVIQARNSAMAATGSPDTQVGPENMLTGALRQMFALAESYPDLKANTNFINLQDELANTEDRIQAARRFYNSNVRNLNNKIEMFPSNMIAGMMNLEQREFFEIEEPEMREVPQVEF